jgi:hypothetical protein
MAKKPTKVATNEAVQISAPNFETADFKIRGTAPYMQHKFTAKAKMEILGQQTKKSGAKGKKKEPRDIDATYQEALHVGEDGKYGIPCAAFRSALIDACRAAGAVMTLARMSVFCLPDTIDAEEGTPLVHIEGDPKPHIGHVRIGRGTTSVAIRPIWTEWSATVRLRWDGDQFGMNDVANLLMRAGVQVGVGEGRPFSKNSHGMGLGTFEIVGG